MEMVILKLIAFFLIILVPLMPVRLKKNNKQIKALKSAGTALSDYAIDEDGSLAKRQLISNTNN